MGQGDQTATPAKGTGLLVGRVVDASGGRPVGGVLVSISGGPVPPPGTPPVDVLIGGVANVAGAGQSAPRQVITDSSGRFLFHDLAAGRYTIRATVSGYLPATFGQNRVNGLAQSIWLTTDDEKKNDLVIRMWKTATISGTAVDEAGEPIAEVQVRALRRTTLSGGQRLVTGAVATTDDRGAFRLTNLPPGDYIVGVMSTSVTMPVATTEAYMEQMMAGGSSLNSPMYRDLSDSGAPSVTGPGYRMGDLIYQTMMGRGGTPAGVPVSDTKLFIYPTQFYPSAATPSQATSITLRSGEDRSGLDLQLRLVPSFSVSGVVMGPDGPVPNLGVKLYPTGADEALIEMLGTDSASTATDAAGQFTFLGVAPGQYLLKCLRVPRPVSQAMSPSAMTMVEVAGPNGMMMGFGSSIGGTPPVPPPLPPDPSLWGQMAVSVGDADVTGLSVTLRAGARFSGRLEFEGTRQAPTPDQMLRANIQINQANAAGSPTIQILLAAKRVETDGRFATVGYPAGRYTVGASIGVQGWTLKSAMFNGRDVSGEPFDVGSEDVAGIVITFTDHPSDLSGTVLDAKGQPDKSAEVIVLPADSQTWKQGVVNSRRMRDVRISSTGAYEIAGLPAGDYLIAAVSGDAITDWADPNTLQAVAAVATHFTIADGEKKTLALTSQIIR